MSQQDIYVHDSNSFVTGFTFGLFAGAAGYFLFGTKKGEELRRQLVIEWEEAKEHMAQEGVITHQKVSLRDFLEEFLHTTIAHTENMKSVEVQPLSAKKAGKTLTPTPVAPKKTTAKKFKGV